MTGEATVIARRPQADDAISRLLRCARNYRGDYRHRAEAAGRQRDLWIERDRRLRGEKT
jgi:hypothetical protein